MYLVTMFDVQILPDDSAILTLQVTDGSFYSFKIDCVDRLGLGSSLDVPTKAMWDDMIQKEKERGSYELSDLPDENI